MNTSQDNLEKKLLLVGGSYDHLRELVPKLEYSQYRVHYFWSENTLNNHDPEFQKYYGLVLDTYVLGLLSKRNIQDLADRDNRKLVIFYDKSQDPQKLQRKYNLPQASFIEHSGDYTNLVSEIKKNFILSSSIVA